MGDVGRAQGQGRRAGGWWWGVGGRTLFSIRIVTKCLIFGSPFFWRFRFAEPAAPAAHATAASRAAAPLTPRISPWWEGLGVRPTGVGWDGCETLACGSSSGATSCGQ